MNPILRGLPLECSRRSDRSPRGVGRRTLGCLIGLDAGRQPIYIRVLTRVLDRQGVAISQMHDRFGKTPVQRQPIGP